MEVESWLGEQGAESIHANFNGIERSFANTIHNRVDRLRYVSTTSGYHRTTFAYKKGEEVSARDPSRESLEHIIIIQLPM
jgi:hypothetical protein